MTSYAIAQLHQVTMGPPIVTYLEAIDATLAPFGGRFLVHGDPLTRMEGQWPEGSLIIIAFPHRAALEAWYVSPAYQCILPLRTANASGDVIFVDGVAEPHLARDVLSVALTPDGPGSGGSAAHPHWRRPA